MTNEVLPSGELTPREVVKKIFNHLTKEQREKLKAAHQQEIAFYIQLPNNRFIGCHVQGSPMLLVEHFYNNWCVGTRRY